MASIGWVLLLFLAHLHTLLSTSIAHHAIGGNLTHHPVPFLCHPDQAKALLQLKKSFSFSRSTTRLSSWRNGSDCCLWEGVACDVSSGYVTVLDLNNRGLYSHGLDPALFNLRSLRRLDPSMNDIGGNIPPGFERFAFLTHLNLSNLGLYGEIPIGISKLVSLFSLDLSSHLDNQYICDPGPNNYIGAKYLYKSSSLDTLVANLSNLRELYLDSVDLSCSGEEWGIALARSVPFLEVLSLAYCGLHAPIHKSLSRFGSLIVVNLQGNIFMAPGLFPVFFMDLINLTTLQLPSANLEGSFPPRSFQSKNLRVLDLSDNPYLSGHFPDFSDTSSLEILRLERTNFSYARPMSSSNFKSLKNLSLDGNLSVDFLSSFGGLGSLCQLDLALVDSVSELGSIFSWIGHHKSLTSLKLFGCNFSGITPTLLVSNFKTLKSLRMVSCKLPRLVLHSVGNLVGLQTLEMTGCTTYGSMPSSIGNLTNLRNLCINHCGFLGPMPAAIGKLTNLRNMYINDFGFSGPIPDAIGNLTNLNAITIIRDPGDQVSGSSIPYAIGQLSELEWLVLQHCKFSGSIPTSIGNLTQLMMLDLSENSLSGEIPSSIFNLSVLHYLDLSSNKLSGPIQGFDNKVNSQLETVRLRNNTLSGEIPPSIFSLPVLRILSLSDNQLSGPIQYDNTASQLKEVDLGYNALSGSIPEAIFQISSLEHIDVSSNNLTGSVDLSHFSRLTELTSLYLSHNKLHVTDDAADNPLAGVTKLGLASCNITRFPRLFMDLNLIWFLDLSCNKISGDIPNWIWASWRNSIVYLNLSDNMLTGMQLTSDVLPFANPLQVLDLSFNILSGRIHMPNLSADILNYSNNKFSSILPNWAFYLSETRYFSVSKNNINGHVPLSICSNSSWLQVLDLSYNNFSGSIPACLIENVPLMVLNLRENHFEEMLPSNITTRCALQTIHLHGNKIVGKLPRGLSNCSCLEVVDFGGNQIVDTFPSWLRGLPELSVLILRSNQLYGTIGDIVEDAESDECFPSLQIIDLSSNNFSGNLKPEWFKLLKSMMEEFNSPGKIITHDISSFATFYHDFTEITYKGTYVTFRNILTTLTAIDFSNNRLEGTIPETFGRLVSLLMMNMSHNSFTGKIPAQLGSMADLESLDLSCNQLSGEIPQELTDLTFLGVLNLSNNDLVGEIPQANQFSTFNSSSFEGNAGLCGPPLSKSPCGATPNAGNIYKSSRHVDVALFLFVGLGFGIGFAAAIVAKWGRVGRWFTATGRAWRT
ncbi:unnamed protein product [Urochloa decumbens]|uniref:Leucine-rich repeat-containing N-terminal plant-type domain-containing protein n=2 Tax=Urochloa decumbens TaxID=240449 RepID=A0ABC9BWK6_9POAL